MITRTITIAGRAFSIEARRGDLIDRGLPRARLEVVFVVSVSAPELIGLFAGVGTVWLSRGMVNHPLARQIAGRFYLDFDAYAQLASVLDEMALEVARAEPRGVQ